MPRIRLFTRKGKWKWSKLINQVYSHPLPIWIIGNLFYSIAFWVLVSVGWTGPYFAPIALDWLVNGGLDDLFMEIERVNSEPVNFLIVDKVYPIPSSCFFFFFLIEQEISLCLSLFFFLPKLRVSILDGNQLMHPRILMFIFGWTYGSWLVFQALFYSWYELDWLTFVCFFLALEELEFSHYGIWLLHMRT